MDTKEKRLFQFELCAKFVSHHFVVEDLRGGGDDYKERGLEHVRRGGR